MALQNGRKLAPRVCVLGGGISGLTSALFIQDVFSSTGVQGSVAVYEQSPQVGGWVGSNVAEAAGGRSFLFERGPRSLRTSNSAAWCTLNLIDRLGIESEVIPASADARRRFVFLDGEPRPMPTSLLQALQSPLMRRVLASGAKEAFLPPRNFVPDRMLSDATFDCDDESIHAFFSRRFGREVADTFADALVSGVFAGDPKLLSVRSCFPAMYDAEKHRKSVVRGMMRSEKSSAALDITEPPKSANLGIVSFKGGLQTLSDAVGASLRDSHCPVHTGSNVDSVEYIGKAESPWLVHANGVQTPYDYVVSALPAFGLADVLNSTVEHSVHQEIIAEQVLKNLRSIKYSSLAVVNCGYSSDVLGAKGLHGFGYLIPEQEKQDILGMVWDSSTFPTQRIGNGAGESRLTVMIGGEKMENFDDVTESQFEQMANASLRKHLGIEGTPDAVQVNVQRKCIAQYNVGHHAKLAAINYALGGDAIGGFADVHPQQGPSLFGGSLLLTGSSYCGVGVNDCVANSYRTAKSLKGQLLERKAI